MDLAASQYSVFSILSTGDQSVNSTVEGEGKRRVPLMASKLWPARVVVAVGYGKRFS
jgi:hypothetical protein